MKSKVMSMDEPRVTRTSPQNARNSAYRPGNGRVRPAYSASGQGRISPWLPVALGGVALLLVLRALTQEEKRSTTERWMHAANRRVGKWWPELRDTVEDYGHRASRTLPDTSSTLDWLSDMVPSRRGLSNLFASSSDWLPNVDISKRQLLANFDWSNPPRWLRNIDLSTQAKRRRFMRDLRRHGTRKRDDLFSAIGWR